MVQSPAEQSGNVDERASATAMQLLAITIGTLCAALLAVAARCATSGLTLAYGITVAVVLAMLLAGIRLRGVARRELTASASRATIITSEQTTANELRDR
jgi:hypothetical protein